MTAASSRTRWARVGRTAAGRHGVGGGDCGQATDQIQPQPRPRRRPRATAGGQNEPSARQLWTARATLDRHHRPRIRGQGQDPSGTATARPWLRRNPPRAGTSREEPPRGAKTSRRRGSSGRRARLSTGTTARGSVDKAKIRREPRRRGRGSAATHLEPAPRGRHLRAPTKLTPAGKLGRPNATSGRSAPPRSPGKLHAPRRRTATSTARPRQPPSASLEWSVDETTPPTTHPGRSRRPCGSRDAPAGGFHSASESA